MRHSSEKPSVKTASRQLVCDARNSRFRDYRVGQRGLVTKSARPTRHQPKSAKTTAAPQPRMLHVWELACTRANAGFHRLSKRNSCIMSVAAVGGHLSVVPGRPDPAYPVPTL